MPEIDFKRQPSRQHAAFLFAVVFCAILSVFDSSLPMLMKLLLMLGVFAYGIRLYHREVRLLGASLLALSHDHGRLWLLTTSQGIVKAEVRSSVVVTAWVSVLNFKAEDGGVYRCMFFPDSLAPGLYRQFLTKF